MTWKDKKLPDGASVIFGEEGTKELLYLASWKATWKGPATDLSYETKQTGEIVKVDLRDAECMLGWLDAEGNPFFEEVMPF